MEPLDQFVRAMGCEQFKFDVGEEVNDGAEVDDLAGLPFELAKVEQFGNERLGDVLMFAAKTSRSSLRAVPARAIVSSLWPFRATSSSGVAPAKPPSG